jgi:uncharacterized protein YndB with AHSA1/START domain
MKLIKRIFLFIVGLILLLLVITIFVPRHYDVEREITINKSRPEVFDYIKHLKNQDNYSKWAMMDPAMKKEYSGTDGTIGFVYGWDSEEAGKGEQEIKKVAEHERLDIEIRFKKPFESTGEVRMITEENSPGQTTVKWGMKGDSKYPLNFMNLFMNRILGRDLETGLANLKTLLESK